ncbi:MAG TPA: ABC transporter substrate-binding protein [Solirubrobacteraceae bacterium]|nr:ABC transporter substrate-binding protein [Solirubrobacteraceae bacterium]
MRPLALAALAVATLALPAGGVSGGTPGVTPSQILLGGTVPLSGNASAFGTVGPGANAYFKYVNAHGGVYGRKIKYIWRDDGYDPARTIEQTRELVQQDKVFAIFNTVGTEHNVAIRAYLNAVKVPQVFGGTGASVIGRGYKKFPWTMGYLPSFVGEGAIYGRYVVKHRPKARIAVLYENSDYGRDLLHGLERGLGKKRSRIVAKATYEVTDSDVNSQIAKLRRSKADTFMLFALPQQAIQSFVYAYKLKWRPQIFVSAVSIEPRVMAIARIGTNGVETNNALSVAFVKDPTSPAWRKDKAVALYKRIMKRYFPGGQPGDVYNWYGMTVAFSMVDALRHAGRNPSRESLRRAMTHMDERNNPFLLPGVTVKTSPSNYYPMTKAKMVRYRKNVWVLFGPLVNAR